VSWRPRRTWLGAAAAAVALSLGAAAWVPLPERLAAPPSRALLYRDGTLAYVQPSPDGMIRFATRAGDVDPDYLSALKRLEDKRFDGHPGVDVAALARAAWLNLTRGHRVSGGSTLTMQLVRVLEPRPRTLPSKVVEIARALQLELRLSKPEILDAYLTFVPFGHNVEGVEAASWAYFGHSARHLAADEVATLLAVPQQPTRRHPSEENVDRLRRGRDEVARRLLAEGFLPREAGRRVASAQELWRWVTQARVPAAMVPFPHEAPHAAFWLFERFPSPSTLTSTLDRGTQRLLEQRLASERPLAQASGIHNASALVVEHRTRQVVAAVGNFDFRDEAHGGQVVGFDAPRSPGSVLKPFIYARAIDEGLAGPRMVFTDVPVQYGPYAPQNFDGTFRGLVTLETALSQSLNIPFVEALSRVGVPAFLGDLRALGAQHLRGDEAYGLSAAVGGVEVTPAEVAAMFATLAEDGESAPLRWLEREPPATPRRRFSAGASWLTRRALALRDRPDFPERRELNPATHAIHWKTGTSFGHRDAWAAGSNLTHTAVVWMGNFDNTPSHALVGASASGPVLFDVLEAVEDRSRVWTTPPAPAELIAVQVCADSGYAVTPACPRAEATLALRTAVPTRPCPVHHRVEVDEATGEAVNAACRGQRHTRWETVTSWPASVQRWLAQQGQPAPAPPRRAAACAPDEPRSALALVSPPAGQVAMLLPGLAPARQEIPLQAESDALGGSLSWFVDAQFVGRAPPEQTLYWTPSVGRHRVVVRSDAGQTASRELEVRVRPF
jgi:penicillin-binding protein 1C